MQTLRTKTIKRKKTTPRTCSLPRMARARHAAGPAPELAPRAASGSTNTTFDLADFAGVFGSNFADGASRSDPLSIAMDVIDEQTKLMFVAMEVMGRDETGLSEVLTAAWNRGRTALGVLQRFWAREAAARNLADRRASDLSSEVAS